MASKAAKTPTKRNLEIAHTTETKGFHQTIEAAANPHALLRLTTVCDLLGMAESTVRKYRRLGKFPEPFSRTRAGGGPLRWLASDIYAWQEKNRGAAPAD